MPRTSISSGSGDRRASIGDPNPGFNLEMTGFAGFVMNNLSLLTVVGVFVGIGVGIGLSYLDTTPAEGEALTDRQARNRETIELFGLPGVMFINFFKAVVAPLIFCAMVAVSRELGSQLGGPVSKTVVYYYLTTTFVAAFGGILWFNIFQWIFVEFEVEGDGTQTTTQGETPGAADRLTIAKTIIEFAGDVVAPNIVQAFLSLNIIGLVFFGLFFGSVAYSIPGGDKVIDFFSISNLILMGMIRYVLPFTPLGVGSLVCRTVARNASNLGNAGWNIGFLILLALWGYLMHICGFYFMLYTVYARRNACAVLGQMVNLWPTSFGTSSSAATLSKTQEVCRNLGFKESIIKFVTPIGCTINMDGSAIERVMTVLWVAKCTGYPIGFAQQIIVAIISVCMSIGGAPIPSSGVSTILLMVDAAGVDVGDPDVAGLVALRLGVEWLLDGFNTSVNVTGDVFGTGIADAANPMFTEADMEAELVKAKEEPTPIPVVEPGSHIEAARAQLRGNEEEASAMEMQAKGTEDPKAEKRNSETAATSFTEPDPGSETAATPATPLQQS